MINQWTNIRGFVFFFLIFLFVLLADILVVYNYYRFVHGFIQEQPKNVKADAGILFFGDYNKRGTALGPDSRNRAMKAVSLYNQGFIGSIICVGGYEISHWKGKPHLMMQYLMEQGIPRYDILYDSLSFNTITNWYEARKLMKMNNIDTVIAISAPLHVFRISKITGTDVVFYCAYDYKPASIPEYWQVFKDVHHEFASHLLSFALNDRVRNQIIRIYRALTLELNRIL